MRDEPLALSDQGGKTWATPVAPGNLNVLRNHEEPAGEQPVFQVFNPLTSTVEHRSSLGEAMFPLAIADGKVVYADRSAGSLPPIPDWARGPTGEMTLYRYTKETSLQRRREFQCKLADMALKHPHLTQEAISEVNAGIMAYLAQTRNDEQVRYDVANCVSKYMYSGISFGRIGEPHQPRRNISLLFNQAIHTLHHGELPSILAIHDFMGRIFLRHGGGTQEQNETMVAAVHATEPVDLFGPRGNVQEQEKMRGRTKRPELPNPTTSPGLLHPEEATRLGIGPYQSRLRGSEVWMPAPQQDEPPFNAEIRERNLLFAAGPSRTAALLFQAAKLFGNLEGEKLKQYALAVTGYLVGGGMHSYHEVMCVAKRAGVPYKEGAYTPSLPQTILASSEFKKCSDEYKDIADFGARLWNLPEACVAPKPLARSRLDEMSQNLHLYRDITQWRAAYKNMTDVSDRLSVPTDTPTDTPAAPGAPATGIRGLLNRIFS